MTNTMIEDIATRFRVALRGIASTVCVVTSSDGDRRHGMTVTSVTSLTMDPPALLVCLNRSTSLSGLMRVTQGFCVNVLGQQHEAVSRAFSGGAAGEDRFLTGNWQRQADTGLPYLVDAQSVLFCRKAAAFPYGTHTILIGDVTDVIADGNSGPLIYQNAGYAALPERPR